MANGNFVVQNGLQVGALTIFAGNGDIVTQGNVSSMAASATFDSINATPIGNATPSTGVFTTLNASSGITGTLSTASQPNITSVGTLTGLNLSGAATSSSTVSATAFYAPTIGNSGATLTGTLSTASQPNITSVGTLTGLTNSGTERLTTQLTSTGTTSSYGTLSVGGAISYGPDYGLMGSFVANIPAYSYIAAQNLSTGGNASTSFTAYNDTGTSYLDLGINSSNFNASSSGFVNNSLNSPSASYAYATGGDMVIGTWNNNGIHFITDAVSTIGDSMFIAGNGNVYISGNLTVSGNTTQINTITTFLTESANLVSTAYLAGNASTNSSTITLNNIMIPNGSSVTLGTVSAPYSGIYGTLQTASQPNITTLGGVTSIGASGSTALTGTLQTAAQTNVTSVGTLSSLTVSGALNANGQLNTAASIIPTNNNTQNIGSGSFTYATVYATTFSGVSTTAKYADLAENYQGDKQYNPGTVVMFGGAQEVTVADADTTRVAGIVSTNPAHLMNGGLTGSNVVPLALQGRVPCMVIGPVAKGDIMVSAGFGYAKVNNTPAVGTVIGKALTDFPIAGKGVIEVVVGRF